MRTLPRGIVPKWLDTGCTVARCRPLLQARLARRRLVTAVHNGRCGRSHLVRRKIA